MDAGSIAEAPANSRVAKASAVLLRCTSVLLVITVWVSAGLFGLYILAFYATALYRNNVEKWNEMLPGLYQQGAAAATTGMGLHFAMGGIILVLGSIQLIEAIRVRYSAFHRWVGRIYVVASMLAAIGGLVFIFAKGTIGGTVMNIGFALYGILMLVAGTATYRHAAAGRIEQHRAWALRLYALAIGSWLYRMDYGFWLLLADGMGHLRNFEGPFDRTMAFFFYLPNLLVAELFIRRTRNKKTAPWLNVFSSVLLLGMIYFLLVGTYYFTKYYWGPAIAGWFAHS
jgi:hypothetical protein